MLSHFSHVQFFPTLWTVAHQTPLSMGFSRQAHWSGLPCPPPGDLSNPGFKPASLTCHHNIQIALSFVSTPAKLCTPVFL